MAVPLNYVVALSAVIFSIGLYAVLTKRSAILVLMAVELMINAANINFVAFAVYRTPFDAVGWVFALISIGIAAAAVGVGLAILLALYKTHESIEVEDVKDLKW